MKISDIKISPDSCTSCPQGKAITKAIHGNPIPHSFTLFSLVHSDLSGVIHVPSFEGAHYAILFVEDKSRFSFLYLVPTKDKFAKSLEVFSQIVETQFDTKIKCLYTDCRGEYIGKETRGIIEKRGIIHTMTTSHTPAHNSVSERKLRVIFTLACTMLLHANLPATFWGEAVVYATRISNCISTTSLEDNGNISPYESLFCKRPDISRFHVFGYRTQMLIKDAHLTKFQSRTKEMIYLGPSQDSTGHRLWDPVTKKVSVSKDVTFFENTFSSLNQSIGKAVSFAKQNDLDDSDFDEEYLLDQ
jgi:hypothetical protein